MDNQTLALPPAASQFPTTYPEPHPALLPGYTERSEQPYIDQEQQRSAVLLPVPTPKQSVSQRRSGVIRTQLEKKGLTGPPAQVPFALPQVSSYSLEASGIAQTGELLRSVFGLLRFFLTIAKACTWGLLVWFASPFFKRQPRNRFANCFIRVGLVLVAYISSINLGLLPLPAPALIQRLVGSEEVTVEEKAVELIPDTEKEKVDLTGSGTAPVSPPIEGSDLPPLPNPTPGNSGNKSGNPDIPKGFDF